MQDTWMAGSCSQLAWQDPPPLSTDYGRKQRQQPLLGQPPAAFPSLLFPLLSDFLRVH